MDQGSQEAVAQVFDELLLKTSIQDRTHDSIEDARSALLLMRLYEKFVADGTLDEEISKLYAAGEVQLEGLIDGNHVGGIAQHILFFYLYTFLKNEKENASDSTISYLHK